MIMRFYVISNCYLIQSYADNAAHFFKTNVHVKANSRSRMDTVIYYGKNHLTSL